MSVICVPLRGNNDLPPLMNRGNMTRTDSFHIPSCTVSPEGIEDLKSHVIEHTTHCCYVWEVCAIRIQKRLALSSQQFFKATDVTSRVFKTVSPFSTIEILLIPHYSY